MKIWKEITKILNGNNYFSRPRFCFTHPVWISIYLQYTEHQQLLILMGNTTVPGPPASWNLVFLAKIPQDHSYISPGTIKIAKKRPRGPLPGAFSFLSFFPKNLQFYEIGPNSLIFWPTIKCYTISESSCHTRRRVMLVIDLVGSTNE